MLMEMSGSYLLCKSGAGGSGLLETSASDPSHLTSKDTEWKFPSAM